MEDGMFTFSPKDRSCRKIVYYTVKILMLVFLAVTIVYLLAKVAMNDSNNPETTDIESVLLKQQSRLNQLQMIIDNLHDYNYTASNGKQFLLTVTKFSYKAAEVFCRENKGHVITSGRRDAVLWREIYDKFLKNRIRFKIWLGLTDFETEGSFKWTDGVNATASNTYWSYGEPNDYLGEDCTIMFPTEYLFNDVNCDQKHFAICEI